MSATQTWELTFADGFGEGRGEPSGQLDTSKWSTGYGWGMTSDNKLERIDPSCVNVDGNADELVLTADRPSSDEWLSGAVNTKGKHYQRYGVFEARIKPPEASDGILPAFWAKPNNEDWPPELDVVEWVGSDNQSVHNVHYTDDSGSKSNHESVYEAESDLTQDYHVYGAQWTPEEVIWYVDTYEVGRASEMAGSGEGQFNAGHDFYLMLNIHLWAVDWLGDPRNLDSWPYEMRVDWVRCWQPAGGYDGG